MSKLYLAGPMTGIPKHNFPAFDEAAARLRLEGHEVISPTDLDRGMGYDAMKTSDDPSPETLKKMFMADLTAVMYEVDKVALLPGWRKSKGACIEVALACMIGKKCYEIETGSAVEFHASTASGAAIQAVAFERQRQIDVEGFSPEFDAGRNQGILAGAGACYAMRAAHRSPRLPESIKSMLEMAWSRLWPWAEGYFKPKSFKRDLERAGALIIAEMERE